MKGFWDDSYTALAVYNGEVARGVLHSDEHKERMRKMQDEYDARRVEYCRQNGVVVYG